MNNADVVQELQAYALANYNAGGHWIYETSSDADYLAVYEKANGNVKKAKALLKAEWKLLTAYAGELN